MQRNSSTNKLPPVPSRFPDRPVDQAREPWWIAKVKPRQEKLLAEDFVASDIEYYLPLVVKNTPRPGSKLSRIFHVPLFPGYIAFAQKSPENIFSTGRVASIIEIKHQARFVRELGQIYSLFQSDAQLFPVTDAFQLGTSVKITRGPFRGVEGIVSTVNSSVSVILKVEYLGNAALKINPAWLEESAEVRSK